MTEEKNWEDQKPSTPKEFAKVCLKIGLQPPREEYEHTREDKIKIYKKEITRYQKLIKELT